MRNVKLYGLCIAGHQIDHWPGGRREAYRQMFLAAALCQSLGALCYLAICLPTNVRPGDGLGLWLRRVCDPQAEGRLAIGARVCDRLLFGEVSRGKGAWQRVGEPARIN